MQQRITPTLYPIMQTTMTISVYMTVAIAVYAFFYIRPKHPENDKQNSIELDNIELGGETVVRESNMASLEDSNSQEFHHPSMTSENQNMVYITVISVITLSSIFNIPRWFEIGVVENTVSLTHKL